jgi:hypothetical protein
MFKNRKLEVRLVKDDASVKDTAALEKPALDAEAIAQITEAAAVRLGKKLILGIVVTVAAVAVVTVLANAADSALEQAIIND